jgi:hypothetical protein
LPLALLRQLRQLQPRMRLTCALARKSEVAYLKTQSSSISGIRIPAGGNITHRSFGPSPRTGYGVQERAAFVRPGRPMTPDFCYLARARNNFALRPRRNDTMNSKSCGLTPGRAGDPGALTMIKRSLPTGFSLICQTDRMPAGGAAWGFFGESLNERTMTGHALPRGAPKLG